MQIGVFYFPVDCGIDVGELARAPGPSHNAAPPANRSAVQGIFRGESE
jgi:hypothetical protein